MDSLGLSEYVDWVEHEHSKNRKQNRPDDPWYKKRIGWISRLRTIGEDAKKVSREAAKTDILLRID
jgi:hypothetical protein